MLMHAVLVFEQRRCRAETIKKHTAINNNKKIFNFPAKAKQKTKIIMHRKKKYTCNSVLWHA